jgi:copper homeostasis protein
MILIETAITSLDDAVAAHLGGADRLELSGVLEVGGVTPSLGTLGLIKKKVPLPVIVMLRPRAGGFVYSDAEFRTMLCDAELFLGHGADGLAFGFLNQARTIDVQRSRALVERTGSKEAVFHRAFDLTTDPFAALDRLIEMKVTRVLTSGQERSALAGAELIHRLIVHAAGRIEILPGGGITPQNVGELVVRTGATQIHGTFSVARLDRAEPVCGDEFRVTSAEWVASTRDALGQVR